MSLIGGVGWVKTLIVTMSLFLLIFKASLSCHSEATEGSKMRFLGVAKIIQRFIIQPYYTIYLQETTMMIHTPLTMTKEGVIAGGQPGDYPDYHQRTSNNQYQGTNNEFKLPTRKEKESILLRYAKKLGLNDRGCYLAVGLSLITFLLLVVIIIMAACWPGEYRKKNSRHYN